MRELDSLLRRYALSGREEDIVLPREVSNDAEQPDARAKSGTYREHEKRIILETLTRTHWNRRKAALVLGISYNTLRRRIAQYGFTKDRLEEVGTAVEQ